MYMYMLNINYGFGFKNECFMGLILIIILIIWGLFQNEIFFSFRLYWINEIYLFENKFIFFY